MEKSEVIKNFLEFFLQEKLLEGSFLGAPNQVLFGEQVVFAENGDPFTTKEYFGFDIREGNLYAMSLGGNKRLFISRMLNVTEFESAKLITYHFNKKWKDIYMNS